MTLRVILSLALLPGIPGRAQVPLGAEQSVRLLPSDASILEGREQRRDLPCTLKAIKPELGFDLVFHSGYKVMLPIEELSGGGNHLTAIFRVIPEGDPDKTAYFSHTWTVPPVTGQAKGTVALESRFVLGEGKYQVEWLLRDVEERFCSTRWQISTERSGKDRPMELRVVPGTVLPEAAEVFEKEAPVPRDGNHRTHVMVLFHVASQVSSAVAMHAAETDAVLSILRSIAREPRIGSFSVTAFNLERSQVLYQRENAPEIDFPALGTAIQELNLGTIDVHKLHRDESEIQFLSKLLGEQMERHRPDAVIFVGPKRTAESPGRSVLKELAEPRCPVFYLNYDANPISNPWRDLIGSVVKVWKGFEYTISRPRDLSVAWNEVMSQIAGKGAATGAADRSAATTRLAPKK